MPKKQPYADLRMIFSESRPPLFGIMRAKSKTPRLLAGALQMLKPFA
jgi:hypothetical protein